MRYYHTGNGLYKSKAQKKGGRGKYSRSKTKRFRQYENADVLSFSNPFKNRVEIKPLKIKSYLLGIFLIAWILLLIYLPYFQINKIEYSGLKIISNTELEKEVNGIIMPASIYFPRNHFFFINESKLKEVILDKFPIDDVKITKTFPNHLSITIYEKNSSVIVDNSESYALLDSQGRILKFIRQVSDNELIFTSSTLASTTSFGTSTNPIAKHEPDIKSFEEEYPNLQILYFKNQILDKDQVIVKPGIIQTVNDFASGIRKGTGLKIKYFILNEKSDDLQVITNKPWIIKISSERCAEKQIIALNSILKSSSPKEYIDVRLEDRLFWK